MNISNISIEREQQIVPNMVFGTEGICTYCGDIATDIDHVIPLSQYSQARPNNANNKGIRTFACNSCNLLLSDKYFNTFEERLNYIFNLNIKAAGKTGKSAVWTQKEIDELDWSLRSYVASRQLEIYNIQKKADWCYSSQFYRNILDLHSNNYLNKKSPKFLDWLYIYFENILHKKPNLQRKQTPRTPKTL